MPGKSWEFAGASFLLFFCNARVLQSVVSWLKPSLARWGSAANGGGRAPALGGACGWQPRRSLAGPLPAVPWADLPSAGLPSDPFVPVPHVPVTDVPIPHVPSGRQADADLSGVPGHRAAGGAQLLAWAQYRGALVRCLPARRICGRLHLWSGVQPSPPWRARRL